MNQETIIERIMSIYPDATIDLEGADCSFEVFVVTPAFEGKNTLQRQRSILDLFSDELKTGKLHALSIKARTPVELQSTGGLVQIKM